MTIICITCHQPTPYLGVGQYCCRRCRRAFLWHMKGKPLQHKRKENQPCPA